jgi:hypothetical protein
MHVRLWLVGSGALALAAGVAGILTTPPRDTAYACSVGPPMFDQLMLESNVVALADIVQVGGAANTQPTATPRATYTPTATPTPGSPTPTIDPVFPSIDSPTATATATPFDLTGYGASASVVKSYLGNAGSMLSVDPEGRIALERALRQEEARRPGDPVAPCPAFVGHFKYTTGHRYVLFGHGDAGAIETPIYGQWEVLSDATGQPYVLARNMYVPRDVYETYMRGIDAVADERWYYITADRIPLDTFERMITSAPPGRPPIVPPTTGTAGLKR